MSLPKKESHLLLLSYFSGDRNGMKFLSRLTAVTLVGIAAIASSGVAQAATTPILIKSCVILKPRPMSTKAGGTHISYVNLGQRTASSITFAVGYRNSASHFLRRVTDVGSFAPGATISHDFSLFNDVTYAGSHTSMCVPTQVKYAGGQVWMAPTQPH
jgi:hypothetical protein